MDNYFLITIDDCGESQIKRLRHSELDDILKAAYEYGIHSFVDKPPAIDLAEWPGCTAMIIKGEIIMPRMVTTAWKI